ncbi:hypothetical protein F4860DRAFT_509124 [Xylaria cubensis]|nr:hypothetical protein F4860DRAFT_509124 [Xylaria cubensis]
MASSLAQQMVLGPSNNNTIPPASPPPLLSSENTFSRANVFGLFLTLALCLLVQPYGSLLYLKPTSAVGRSVYFFWRLNPLACVLEVVLLAMAVFDGIVAAVRWRHDPSEESMGFWRHLQGTFRAISLLRSCGRLPDHYKTNRLEGAHQSIAEATRRDHENEATAPLLLNGAGAGTGNDNGPYTDDASPNSSLDIADRQSVRTAGSPPATRSPSQIEEGRGNDPYYSETASMTSPRFRMGRNFVPHAEHVIHLIGTIAVIIVIIKLAAVTIPPHIRIPAWFMVAGWIAVQALVFVSPRPERGHVDPVYVICRAIELEGKLFQPLTWVLFTLLLLPFFGYLTHVWLFQAPALSTSFRNTPFLILPGLLSLDFPLLWKDIPDAFRSCCLRREPQDHCRAKIVSYAKEVSNLSKLELITFFLVGCILIPFGLLGGFYFGISVVICIHEDQPAWNYLLLPFLVTPTLLWAWFLIPADPFMRHRRGAEWTRGVCLVSNLTAVIFFFAGAMLVYDATSTYKPSWVEWLGKLKRFLNAGGRFNS